MRKEVGKKRAGVGKKNSFKVTIKNKLEDYFFSDNLSISNNIFFKIFDVSIGISDLRSFHDHYVLPLKV